MMTLTSGRIGLTCAPALPMNDDADALGLRNDLGLAHVDDHALDARVGEGEVGHLLRQGLDQLHVPRRGRPLLQPGDDVGVGDVIGEIVASAARPGRRARTCRA